MLDPFFEEAEKDIQRRITNCMTLTSGNHKSPDAHYSCYKLGVCLFSFLCAAVLMDYYQISILFVFHLLVWLTCGVDKEKTMNNYVYLFIDHRVF